MPKVWFVTGSSTGFGRHLVEQLAERGDQVAATARRPDQLAGLTARYPQAVITPRLDVTQPAEVAAAVDAAVNRFGRLDVLVNNAGYGVLGGVEELTDGEARRQFDTNVFGLLNVLRAAVPVFRGQRSGHVLNVSSMAGQQGRAGIGIYAASKFAVEGLSEALAAELAPLGVRVTLVEPGRFRTDFLGRSVRLPADPVPDYADTAGRIPAFVAGADGRQEGDPAKAAAAMIAVTELDRPPLRLVLGADADAVIRAKVAAVLADLDAHPGLTFGTAFSDP